MLMQTLAKLPHALESTLRRSGQAHLIDILYDLPDEERPQFFKQLRHVDWMHLRSLFEAWRAGEVCALSPASELQPVSNIVRQPASARDADAWQKARELGSSVLAAGKVAAIMVAGGQGTRLGFRYPKGMLRIGPVSGKSLYQWCCEQVDTRGRQHGVAIPYVIMTSDATHYATVDYFEEHRCFGLQDDDVWFACQGDLPALDAETGQALLTGDAELAWSPDGHGGLLNALTKAGIWERLRERGIEYLFYHQVDNPTTRICDPAFIGWHVMNSADVSTKVVAKRSAAERMGVPMVVDGVAQIVEYSDLPRQIAMSADASGRLTHWAGNTAIHVFNRAFLEEVADLEQSLPLHVAHKAVPYMNEYGERVEPGRPNALKFERFIFDVIPRAESPLFVEANRAEEFNPVKNRSGDDSPQTCQQALIALHRKWLEEAGVKVESPVVEVSPTLAVDAHELAGLFPVGYTVAEPTEITRNRRRC